LGTYNKAGSLAKSFNEAVLPIKEVKRIVKGKGSKGDYAYTALSALPFIGKAGKVVGTGSKIAGKVKTGGKVGKAATARAGSAIGKGSKEITKATLKSRNLTAAEKVADISRLQSQRIAQTKTKVGQAAKDFEKAKKAFSERNSIANGSKLSKAVRDAAKNISAKDLERIRQSVVKTSSQIKKVAVNDTNRTMRSADLQKLKNNRAMLESRRAQPKPNKNLGRQGRIETRRASVESRRLKK
jgi:hypothetical protein